MSKSEPDKIPLKSNAKMQNKTSNNYDKPNTPKLTKRNQERNFPEPFLQPYSFMLL